MLVVPKIMKKAAQQQFQENEKIYPDGKIRVEKNKKNDTGDFVDYEVVD